MKVIKGILCCPEKDGKIKVIPKGCLVVDAAGKILKVGIDFEELRKIGDAEVIDLGSALIVPGFVDAHVHMAQLLKMGSMGYDLLPWLENHIFPEEARLSEGEYATELSRLFCRSLLSQGVTTACVYPTSHEVSCEALFQAAEESGLRLISGQIGMDRHAPEALLHDVRSYEASQKRLIEKWHGRDGRLFYALTPRFAPTCTPELLSCMGNLHNQSLSNHNRGGEIYVQTHWAENHGEIKWVSELYPDCSTYLDVYKKYNLLGPRTLLAHGIHLEPEDGRTLKNYGVKVVHCPTSNTFLGSGFLSLASYQACGLTPSQGDILLGSDVGAGTSLSMWQTLLEAYKIQILETGDPLDPSLLLQWGTRFGARGLGLEESIGGFDPGQEADFQVLHTPDPTRPSDRGLFGEVFCHRWKRAMEEMSSLNFEENCEELENWKRNLLGLLITSAPHNIVQSVYIRGQQVYGRE